jgi:hypothetical protein
MPLFKSNLETTLLLTAECPSIAVSHRPELLALPMPHILNSESKLERHTKFALSILALAQCNGLASITMS